MSLGVGISSFVHDGQMSSAPTHRRGRTRLSGLSGRHNCSQSLQGETYQPSQGQGGAPSAVGFVEPSQATIPRPSMTTRTSVIGGDRGALVIVLIQVFVHISGA